MAGFSVAPGVGAALHGMNDNRAYFTFSGDLSQMGTIYSVLLDAGFPVVKSNVYPGFVESQLEEYKRALKYIFDHRTPGWWNQRSDLQKYEICTEEEFKSALEMEV